MTRDYQLTKDIIEHTFSPWPDRLPGSDQRLRVRQRPWQAAGAPVAAVSVRDDGQWPEAHGYRPTAGSRPADCQRPPGGLGDPPGDIEAQACGPAAGPAPLGEASIREARPVVGHHQPGAAAGP